MSLFCCWGRKTTMAWATILLKFEVEKGSESPFSVLMPTRKQRWRLSPELNSDARRERQGRIRSVE
jgi:hypothetical protein